METEKPRSLVELA